MPQETGWHERIELRLEGGGSLPGASEVVDIKHKVISCTVVRRSNIAQVRGQIQVFAYYRFAGSRKVRGQGVEVPWHAEVMVPDSARNPLLAEVVDVRHEHNFDRQTEHLQHVMYITFAISEATADARKASLPEQMSPQRMGNDDARLRADVAAPKEPPQAPAQIPEWAKEAALDLMRSKRPTAAGALPWLPEDDSVQTREIGQFRGSFTRAGQPYESPTPQWPRGISFELVEKILEGEPRERTLPATTKEVNPVPDDVTLGSNGLEPMPAEASPPQTPTEPASETKSQIGDTASDPISAAQESDSASETELAPQQTTDNLTQSAPDPEPKQKPTPAQEALVWRRFPKTELPKI